MTPPVEAGGFFISKKILKNYKKSVDIKKFILVLDQTNSLVYNKNELNNTFERGEIVGVGRKIAEVRKQKGLSQEHIATKMNRTPQWLSNIERETRPISADELAQVANILGVSPSIFFNK